MAISNYRICPTLSMLFLAITSTCLVAELPDPCKDNHAELARLTERSAIYAESQDLAQTLCKRGFQVNSTQRSKEEQLFEGQIGAALYSMAKGFSRYGFCPKRKTLRPWKIVAEPQANGRYRYTFRGRPRILAKSNSAKPIRQIRHENMTSKCLVLKG